MHANLEQKPPLWPHVALLIALLVLCLFAPGYWGVELPSIVRSNHDRTRSSRDAPRQPLPLPKHAQASGVQFVLEDVPVRQLPHGLFAREDDWLPRPSGVLTLIPPAPTSAASDRFAGASAASLRWIGRSMAAWQPRKAVPIVTALVARLRADAPSGVALTGPLLLIGPSDRPGTNFGSESRWPGLGVPVLGVPTHAWEVANSESDDPIWKVPTSLVKQLQQLAQYPATRSWSALVLSDIDRLCGEGRRSRTGTAELIVHLSELDQQGFELAGTTRSERLQTELLRACYALQRRVDLWNQVQAIRAQRSTHLWARYDQGHADRQLQQALAKLTEATGDSALGAQWRQYLLTDRLQSVLDERLEPSATERREVAETFLKRVTTGGLSPSQRRFLASESVADITEQLRWWAAQNVDLERLAACIEAYEETHSPRYAQEVAHQRLRLAWSPREAERRLAAEIGEHYRNANVRLVLTEEMLNQLLPAQTPRGTEPVHDRISGTPVRGRQQTEIELRAQLLPDPNAARLALLAEGHVTSQTVSFGSGGRLWCHGTTDFEVRKPIALTHSGVVAGQVEAHAESYNRLTGIRTRYDGWPLIGQLAQREARSQYFQKRGRAKAEVQRKVSERASAEVNDQAQVLLANLERSATARIAALQRTGVHVEPVSLSTLDKRLVARLRIAADDQLAGHTPRNRAPADSLASAQIHESVLVNVTRCLELDGQQLSASELRRRLQEKLPALAGENKDELDPATTLHFAYEDALRFRFHRGQMEVTLDLVEMTHDRQTVRNFKVHAFYEPRINGLRLALARKGALGIEGRIRPGDRARLHAIFNKVFADDADVTILDWDQFGLPPLEDVMITQAVMEDGWFGVALGPATAGRTAQRIRALR